MQKRDFSLWVISSFWRCLITWGCISGGRMRILIGLPCIKDWFVLGKGERSGEETLAWHEFQSRWFWSSAKTPHKWLHPKTWAPNSTFVLGDQATLVSTHLMFSTQAQINEVFPICSILAAPFLTWLRVAARGMGCNICQFLPAD